MRRSAPEGWSGRSQRMPWRPMSRMLACMALLWVWASAAGAGDLPGPQGRGHRQLTVVVMADVGGWISSSALYPRRAPQGLAHLSAPLEALRRKDPHLVALALRDWVHGAPAPDDPTTALLRIGESLGIAAALPGEGDLRRVAGAVNPFSTSPTLPWVGSDLQGLPGVRSSIVLASDGLRVGIIGLTRPGVLAATQLERRAIAILPAEQAAAAAVAALEIPDAVDLRVALVNGTWDGAENQATAWVEGRPVRHGVPALADGSIPVDVIIARGGRLPKDEGATPVSVNITPTLLVASGLSVVHLSLESISGRWRVAGFTVERIEPTAAPDPAVLGVAGDTWSRMADWLAMPTRAVVSGYNRKAAFMACAGDLSHAAVAAGVAGENRHASPRAPLSLTPQFWHFEPLRKRERGQAVTRAHLYRWMLHDDVIVPAQLTGRQIALLLEPYARHRSGWTVSPALVLHPGGVVPRIVGRATQPAGLSLAEGGAPLRERQRYPVWLPAFHVDGAGGVARRALLRPEQLGPPLPLPLRELVFRWMASPRFRVPPSCAGFLALAPNR